MAATYNPSDLRKEARNAAQAHANQTGLGKVSNVEWAIAIGDGGRVNLWVSYWAKHPQVGGGNAGHYGVTVAL